MTELSTFTSRTANLRCSAKEFFDFATDIRNFEQFISAESFSNLKADKDSLSFQANMLGTVNLTIAEKEAYYKIVYRGENQRVNDFLLIIEISNSESGNALVIITLKAELNPMLKMLATAPVNRFIDLLCNKMEEYRGWNVTREQNQPL